LENTNVNNNYKLERLKGKLYLNASVHEYLAPYFYPGGDPFTYDYEKDILLTAEVNTEDEERANPDNFDPDAEYNSANDYPDEPENNSEDADDNDFISSGDDEESDNVVTTQYFEDTFTRKIKQKIYNSSPRTDEINYHSNDTDDYEDDS